MSLSFLYRALEVIYPAVCLHCEERTKSPFFSLCQSCSSLISCVELGERCLRCAEKTEGSLCKACQKTPPYFHRRVVACENMGPIPMLLHRYMKGEFFLDQALSAWMGVSYLKTEIPLPDLLVPLPLSRLFTLRQGGDPHLLLANKLGALLDRKVLCPLKYVWEEEGCSFRLNKRKTELLADQKILLIAGGFERRSLEAAAKVLREAAPFQINVLTLL